MNERPTRWGYMTAVTGLLIGIAWTTNAYRANANEVPYEPLALGAASLISLLALVFWKRPKAERQTPDAADTTTQTAEKIYNIKEIEKADFGMKIKDSESVVADATLEAGRDLHIGPKTHIENQYISSGEKEVPRALTNPPFNADFFIGRENDLAAIETGYQQHNRLLVLVNGEGGIGKTTLAAKYWYAHADRYLYLAWLYADAGIGAAMLTLKEKLGVIFEPNDSIGEQLERMAEAINNLKGPCLFVFDNANNETDLKIHYILLNRLSNCHILLTSRVRELADIRVHAVKPLDQEEAVAVFRHHYPDTADAELPLLRDILSAVGYNTLVTELLAKNMAAFNRYAARYSLPDLLRDLQNNGLLALKNKTVTVTYGGDTLRDAEPNAVIAAMYDLAQLNDDERRLLSNLAALPAENIPYDLLATLLGMESDAFEAPLRSLETKGWIEYRKADHTFKISPVVQEVTRQKNADRLLTDCRPLIQYLITGLDNDHRHIDNYQTASVLARMGAAMMQALPVDDDVATLCQHIGDYHQDTGNLSLMLHAYQKMADILTALCAADPDQANFKNGLSISYSRLGDTHAALGHLDQALTFFEKYNDLEKALHESFPQNVEFKNGLAISYERLGNTHAALGNLDQALTFFEKYNDLEKALHESFPQNVEFKNGLAISYSKLGDTHAALGHLDQALTFFEERSRLGKELHEAFPQNVDFKNGLAISYERLGDTHAALGHLDQALTFFEKYNDLEKALHESFPQNVEFKNGLSISYSKLGDTHKALGHLDQALTYFEKDIELSKALHEAFPQNVAFKNNLAISYSKLGDTHAALGHLDQALTYFEKYNDLEKALHEAFPQNVDFKNGLSISYSKLGDTHAALGNLDQALTFFENYNNLKKALHETFPQNVAFKNGLAVSYAKLGGFYRDQISDIAKAKTYFQQAETLWLDLVRDAPHYAEYKQNLGLVQEILNAME